MSTESTINTVECQKCAAWVRVSPESHIGECHRHAPRPFPVVLECLRGTHPQLAPPLHRGGARTRWPDTHETDGCSEWIPLGQVIEWTDGCSEWIPFGQVIE